MVVRWDSSLVVGGGEKVLLAELHSCNNNGAGAKQAKQHENEPTCWYCHPNNNSHQSNRLNGASFDGSAHYY